MTPNDLYLGNDFFDFQDAIEEEEITRIAWSVGYVARILGISNSAVRYHSKTLALDLKFTKGHHNRIYRQKHIDQLRNYLKLCRAGLRNEAAAKNVDNAEEILNLLK